MRRKSYKVYNFPVENHISIIKKCQEGYFTDYANHYHDNGLNSDFNRRL